MDDFKFENSPVLRDAEVEYSPNRSPKYDDMYSKNISYLIIYNFSISTI
ncbi:hypothetical protein [uncultured Methanobrevibacter sp.]|nr:hypothetical protein [uncultured Methanobrevibacter sp.]